MLVIMAPQFLNLGRFFLQGSHEFLYVWEPTRSSFAKGSNKWNAFSLREIEHNRSSADDARILCASLNSDVKGLFNSASVTKSVSNFSI